MNATDSSTRHREVRESETVEYPGATLEGMLHFIGCGFLSPYPQMDSLHISAREHCFDGSRVPANGAAQFAASDVLFARRHATITALRNCC